MNYYIITTTKYNSINKSLIQRRVISLDKSKVLVITTENISDHIMTFDNVETCSQYTIDNGSDWTGDGMGHDVFMLLEGGKFIEELDD